MSDSWRMTLPGPPPTVNHSYRIVKVPRKGGGGLVSTLAKARGIEAYQAGVTYIAKVAKPRGWEPAEKIRLRYWFYLTREIDCDNALKAINDAIALAIRPDASPVKRDRGFLPCVVDMYLGEKDPRVVVEVSNEHSDRGQSQHASDARGSEQDGRLPDGVESGAGVG